MTLDPSSAQIVRRRMQEHGVSFKQAVNDLIQAGAAGRTAPFRTEPSSMGRPLVNLDRALQVAGEVEDEELIRQSRRGS